MSGPIESDDLQAWHAENALAALERFGVGSGGLSSAEAARRLDTYGLNRLPEAAKRGLLVRLLLQFHNVLIYVLLGSAAITAILGHFVDMGVILAVVLANAVIGVIQEGKAEKAMDAIRRMLALQASVIRDGRRQTVEGEKLVPGDVVLLEAGAKVPADMRLLEVAGLKIQEAILTGESVPVEKSVDPVSVDAALGDRACMAFSGTMVTSGLARGVVVASGGATEIGQISGMLSKVETLTTPLIRQMNVFAQWLSVVILGVAALLLLFGHFVRNLDFAELFMAVVGLSVAAIPEGLPAVLTITLAVGVQAMARRNAIVRRLPSIETLGAVSVICTDKTGTLTRNEMMVASVATQEHLFLLEGNGYEPKGTIRLRGDSVDGPDHLVLEEIGRVAALCNDASLHDREGDWAVEGDPMEGALLALSGKIGLDLAEGVASWKRTDTIPFDAKHRFMATLHHDREGHAVISVKGAPERILEMCRDQRTVDGGVTSLDAAYWHEKAEAIAGLGERVLAIAVRDADQSHTVLEFADVEGPLTLLGLVGFIDPPRSESKAAVAECRGAGIGVKMITGDHKGTAMAIGRQIGLDHPDAVLTGADLERMDDDALAAAVLETDVFARTSPEDKLRLVMALQSHGMTVAMTGDGVNDAPALKRADAGIAMGRKGSEAAKEAADLVLADDNFASIVAAVREGRTVYDNIKKVISWTLPTSTGEAMTIIVALLLGMTLPVTPIQILWINLITVTTLGIALAFDPTEGNTMLRRPRPRNQPLLTGDLAWHIVLVSILFIIGVFGIYFYAIEQGHSLELARTLAVNTLVVMEAFQLFFIRNMYGERLGWRTLRATNVVWITVATVTLAQAAMTYLPPLQAVFETEAMPLKETVMIFGMGFALFAVLEIEKRLRHGLRWRGTE
ncbi:cation-transporting P-type ATPase [Hwanghaeella sp.]|uniref:cation-transporting P-type ATPase n=1 Tax=Hwanghaeella sp. TaxID=2605943 RepID=UPI003CCBDF48